MSIHYIVHVTHSLPVHFDSHYYIVTTDFHYTPTFLGYIHLLATHTPLHYNTLHTCVPIPFFVDAPPFWVGGFIWCPVPFLLLPSTIPVYCIMHTAHHTHTPTHRRITACHSSFLTLPPPIHSLPTLCYHLPPTPCLHASCTPPHCTLPSHAFLQHTHAPPLRTPLRAPHCPHLLVHYTRLPLSVAHWCLVRLLLPFADPIVTAAPCHLHAHLPLPPHHHLPPTRPHHTTLYQHR